MKEPEDAFAEAEFSGPKGLGVGFGLRGEKSGEAREEIIAAIVGFVDGVVLDVAGVEAEGERVFAERVADDVVGLVHVEDATLG